MAERRGVQKAFTLIELLIVVAIIAILAAIAVPNFVEAQVRSKVSRVKADIRTIAIAMEAYFVDWNAYPRHLDFYYPTPVEQQEPWWRPLTTPVAYMTTFPRDPFYKKVVFRVEAPTATRLAWTGGFIHYDPWYNTWNGIMADTWGPWSGFVPEMRARGFWFVLRTFGPDGDEDIGGTTGDGLGRPPGNNKAAAMACFYDPSNGTVSSGDIFRLCPGASDNIVF